MRAQELQKNVQRTLVQELSAVRGVGKLIDRRFWRAVEVLGSARGKIVVSGIGKSGQIGQKIASTLTSLGVPAAFLNPAEAMHGDLGIVQESDAVIAISYSGETKELLRLLKQIKHLEVPVVALTGGGRSTLAAYATETLTFRIKEEGSPYNLAPMASSTATLVIGDLLATALCHKRGLTEQHFAKAHPGGALGLKLTPLHTLMKRKNLPIVKKTDPLQRVLQTMTKGGMGLAAVVEKGRLVGVISDGDLRRKLLSSGLSTRVSAKDLMTPRPKTISESGSLRDALVKMEENKITALFVVDKEQKLRGILRMHDVVEQGVL